MGVSILYHSSVCAGRRSADCCLHCRGHGDPGPVGIADLRSMFGRMMGDILNYMQIAPSNQTTLPEVKIVEVPDLHDLTVDEAAALADQGGLLLRLVGEGNYIINQTPKAGARVPQQTQVVVYLGEAGENPTGAISLPDFSGFTVREVGEVLSWLGLRLNAEGSGTAIYQEPDSGTTVEPGSEVTVFFGSLPEP